MAREALKRFHRGQRVYVPYTSETFGIARVRTATVTDEHPPTEFPREDVRVTFEDTGIVETVKAFMLREAPANDVTPPYGIPSDGQANAMNDTSPFWHPERERHPEREPIEPDANRSETDRAQEWVGYLEQYEHLRAEHARLLQEWNIADPLDFDQIATLNWRLQNGQHQLRALRGRVLVFLQVSRAA
jgi:hypothetical protein